MTRDLTISDFTVGQEVVVVWERNSRQVDTVKITKVGRKWVEILDGRYRFQPPNLWLDAGNGLTAGRVWLSRQEYRDATARRLAWDTLRRRVMDSLAVPSHLSTEQLERITKLLNGYHEN